MTKPFLKWAGGKSQLLDLVRDLWLPYRNRPYQDLTLGAGSIPLALRPKEVHANDINPHLMACFATLKSGKDLFNPEYKNFEADYYKLREKFNSLSKDESSAALVERSKLFYYLNRHCFKGLCRFNSKGKFNIPYGNYKRPIYDIDFSTHKKAVAKWHLSSLDFSSVPLIPGAFLVADPPYDGTFTKFSGDFTWENQEYLARILSRHDAPTVAFNAATDRIDNLYSKLGFKAIATHEKRMIAANGNRDSVECRMFLKGFPL